MSGTVTVLRIGTGSGPAPLPLFMENVMQNIVPALAVLLLMGSTPLIAQSVRDTVATDTAGMRAGRAFIDADGDGIEDRAPEKGIRRQRGKDRFIDLDGDGISDSRASGLGLRHGQGKSNQSAGTRQQGPRRGGRP